MGTRQFQWLMPMAHGRNRVNGPRAGMIVNSDITVSGCMSREKQVPAKVRANHPSGMNLGLIFDTRI